MVFQVKGQLPVQRNDQRRLMPQQQGLTVIARSKGLQQQFGADIRLPAGRQPQTRSLSIGSCVLDAFNPRQIGGFSGHDQQIMTGCGMQPIALPGMQLFKALV